MYTDEAKKLGVMSIGFLLENKDDAVVWRGPKKNGESNYCRPEYSVTNSKWKVSICTLSSASSMEQSLNILLGYY